MCFLWLKKLYHCLRGKRTHRSRGYSGEISLSHGGFCSGSFSNPHGHASFSCGREGSVTYTRRPSYCPQPSHCPPASPPYSISGGYTCGRDGYGAATGGDCGGTPGWGVAVGTVPVYGPGWGGGYGPEDSGHAAGGGSGSGYPVSPPDNAPTAGGVGEGAGGYPGGPGCAQAEQQQQKCPVVVPSVKSQQCKQKSHWPPSQKK